MLFETRVSAVTLQVKKVISQIRNKNLKSRRLVGSWLSQHLVSRGFVKQKSTLVKNVKSIAEE